MTENTSMDRRNALRAIALGTVGAVAPATWVGSLSESALVHAATGSALAPEDAPLFFSEKQLRLVTHLAELIIPQTDTAGATKAGVHEFIDRVLEDAPEAEQQSFVGGLDWLDSRSYELFGADFLSAAENQQHAIMTVISSEANQTSENQIGVEFFQAMKSLTVTGYYKSRVGRAEELDEDDEVFHGDDPGCRHDEHQTWRLAGSGTEP